MTALPFDNSYARLPERFYARRLPTPVAAPRLVRLNRPLAEELGLDPDWLAGPDGVAALAGNTVPDGADPIAAAYAGHQFGQFVPQLGDGRAVQPDLVLSICGEHGGNPESIEFCRNAGYDYVSCSPFRVPVARLAAAHLVIAGK